MQHVRILTVLYDIAIILMVWVLRPFSLMFLESTCRLFDSLAFFCSAFSIFGVLGGLASDGSLFAK